MLQLKDADQFYSALQGNCLVLTPNHRLAVALTDTWGALHKEHNTAVIVPSPNIAAVDIWVRAAWQNLVNTNAHPQAHWQLLSTSQEQLIWRDVVNNSTAAETLLNPAASARAAREAHTLLQQHSLDRTDLEAWLQSDWRQHEDFMDLKQFLAWQQLFERTLHDRNFLTLSAVLNIIIDALTSGLIAAPHKLVLFGFTRTPPLYQRLFNALDPDGHALQLHLQPQKPEQQLVQVAGAVQEAAAAADWAAQILRTNADSSVGIVCTDLATRKPLLHRFCSHHPELRDCIQTGTQTLAEEPLIHAALSILELNRSRLATLELCSLLRSPWIGGSDTEAASRAQLELLLRNYTEYSISPLRLRELASRQDKPGWCPDVYQRMQQLAQAAMPLQQKRADPQTWALLFMRQLSLMGWPGPLALNGREQALMERWQELLENFTALGNWQNTISCDTALALLRELAQALPGQMEAATSSLQILSPAEAEHLQFTHLWFMGLNDNLWPGSMQANSLLPWSLQKDLHLPGTDRQLHLEEQHQLFKVLPGNAAQELVCSYALANDDMLLRPSPFLAALNTNAKAWSAAAASQLSPFFAKLRNSVAAELVSSPALLALQEDERSGGGAMLLQNQSSCPFKAFAVHRCAAEEVRVPGMGPDALALGNLLHLALELLWKNLGRHEQLLNISLESKRQLAADCAKQALAKLARQYTQMLQPRFRKLEEARLTTLLLDWLEVEAARPFSEVILSEEKFQWQHKALTLKIKIDRIDRMTDNSLSIIDYKSGRELSMHWLDERPMYPQLFLYLQAVEIHYASDTVSSLLFAYVNARNARFRGIDHDPLQSSAMGKTQLKQLQDAGLDWPQLKALWQQSIENLAEEFLAGRHDPDPRQITQCKQCHVRPFCRIDELKRDIELDEEDDATEVGS